MLQFLKQLDDANNIIWRQPITIPKAIVLAFLNKQKLWVELREKELRALVSKWEEESMNNLHYAYKISWYIVKQRAEFAYNEYGISWKFDGNSPCNQIFFIEMLQEFGTFLQSKIKTQPEMFDIIIRQNHLLIFENEQLQKSIMRLEQDVMDLRRRLRNTLSAHKYMIESGDALMVENVNLVHQNANLLRNLRRSLLYDNEIQKENQMLRLKLQQSTDEEKQIVPSEILHLETENMNLARQTEKLRTVIKSLSDIAINLPPANVNAVKWESAFDPDPTIRSAKCTCYKEIIQSQLRYNQTSGNGYIVELNPLNQDQFSDDEMRRIKIYFERNGVGNVNPLICMKFEWIALDELLDTRIIQKCEWQNALEGQLETFARKPIESGTILGQYVGHELLEEEFRDIYNGTKEEIHHMKYLMGERILFENKWKSSPRKKRKLNNNESQNSKELSIYIDAISMMKDSPLIRINDGRKDILNPVLTASDKERINCEFVSVLINGWIAIILRTTQSIETSESLHVYYGDSYRLVLESEDLINDARKKAIGSVVAALTSFHSAKT